MMPLQEKILIFSICLHTFPLFAQHLESKQTMQ